MIEISSMVKTIIYNAVSPSYTDASFESGLNLNPSVFPCICVEEVENRTRLSTIDSGLDEKYADVGYEINIYSNSTEGKEQEARAICNLIDTAMVRTGFERVSINPMSLNNGTLYRLVVRYQAVVSSDYKIYRR